MGRLGVGGWELQNGEGGAQGGVGRQKEERPTQIIYRVALH